MCGWQARWLAWGELLGTLPDVLLYKPSLCLLWPQVRNEVKAAGLVDTPDNCFDFFIEKVRLLLFCALLETFALHTNPSMPPSWACPPLHTP